VARLSWKASAGVETNSSSSSNVAGPVSKVQRGQTLLEGICRG
jgi:hypothetical protein